MERRIRDLKEALNKPKDIEEILSEQSELALREHRRPTTDVFISAISAGLELGFSVLLIATLLTIFNDVIPHDFLHVIQALAYPLGFIFVILGKSELFTEHTTLAVIPVLNRRASLPSLLRLWLVIFIGNIIGGLAFSYILSVLPVKMNIIETNVLIELAHDYINHNAYIILGSGMLAGWLMGLLSWLVTSSQDTISRIFIISLITSVIGIGKLHHCIVGSIEVYTGFILSPSIELGDYFRALGWATIGNLIGGVVFVAFMKYSHVNTHKALRRRNEQS
ncbi:MAG: formate/nitrite transporter family protein [Bacteroidetes bacterium]|jgi:formate/nitrite transporter FocA (FNT family)|nr:formate/nitrite transporter family protein [Bacteroidota bacterium]